MRIIIGIAFLFWLLIGTLDVYLRLRGTLPMDREPDPLTDSTLSWGVLGVWAIAVALGEVAEAIRSAVKPRATKPGEVKA